MFGLSYVQHNYIVCYHVDCYYVDHDYVNSCYVELYFVYFVDCYSFDGFYIVLCSLLCWLFLCQHICCLLCYMREVKGSGPTSPSMLNITFLNFTMLTVSMLTLTMLITVLTLTMLQESRQRMRPHSTIGFLHHNHSNSSSSEDLNQQPVWLQGGDWGPPGSPGGEEL